MMNKIKRFYEKKPGVVILLSFTLIFTILLVWATVGQKAPYNPNILELGSLTIAWYAVFILTGIGFAAVLGLQEFKKAGISKDLLFDGLLYSVPIAILGARLWFVIFNPGTNFFAFLDGGLAIHGAIIATFVFLIFFTKWKKISYWFVLDVVAPGFLIGQTLGRWGNFMNQELYGKAVNSLNWLPPFIREQMFINGSYRQPTFLYESLWNLMGLAIIIILRKKKAFKLGDILSFYLVWYGAGRIVTESLRLQSGVSEPLMFLGMSVSILTSVALILTGIGLAIGRRIANKNLPYYADFGKKAVIFDVDGTLLDTEKIIIKSFEHAFKKELPDIKLTQEEKISFIGPTLKQTFEKYTKDQTKIEKLIQTYRAYNKELHDQGVKAFEHAETTLITLKKQGIKLAIVSSKIKKMVEEGLKQNNLLQYFDVLVCADDVTNHKPHPEPLLKAMTQLNTATEATIYIGDHPYDIVAAKRAGMKSCLVEYSAHLNTALKENPDYVIESLDQVVYLI